MSDLVNNLQDVKIDVMILNAGALLWKKTMTEENFEFTFAT